MKSNTIIKIILVILLVATGGFFYYKKLLSPKITEIRGINDQISRKKVDLETYKQVRVGKTSILAQNVFYTNWTANLYQILPKKFENKDNIKLVLDLLQVGVDTGVNFSSLNVLDPSISGKGGGAKDKVLTRISKNVIGMNFVVDTMDYPSLQKFNDALLNNFKNIIIPENYAVEGVAAIKENTSPQITYTETFTGYLLLSSDATMPVPVATVKN